jgi:hypothetical protein
MPTTSFAFAIALLALVGTPVLSPVMAWALRRRTAAVQRRAFGLMATVTAAVAGALLGDLSTTSYEANAILLGSGLASAGVLGVSAFRLNIRPWNLVLGVLASLFLCVCLLLGTLGAIAVMFVVGDTVPVHVADLPDHQRCHVTSFGNATTSTNGYDVAIKRRLALLPFIEIQELRRRFDSPSLTPAAACDAAVLAMAGNG